jgi:hypothetical protein
MATYVNDLRLKEIATGDESGTWGTSTNTNLELIAEAFSYGTEASFGSDADATTTIADGATDPARSLYFKVTSGVSLTATRTLTIAPNTVSKVWIIENATTGSQSINISQGSGANVTIPNGQTKIVYTDGAGAGAAVVDALGSINANGALSVSSTDVGVGGVPTSGGVSTAGSPVLQIIGTVPELDFVDTNADDWWIRTSGGLQFGQESNSRVYFEDGGDVGIGTTSPNTGISVATSANIFQVAVTSSSNAVAWDAKAAANAYYATTENTTFSAPTNAVEGAIISVEIAQGGTPYTVAWNTVFEFAASTAPTVTATANKTDIFSFRYNGSVWQEIGRVQNLAQT